MRHLVLMAVMALGCSGETIDKDDSNQVTADECDDLYAPDGQCCAQACARALRAEHDCRNSARAQAGLAAEPYDPQFESFDCERPCTHDSETQRVIVANGWYHRDDCRQELGAAHECIWWEVNFEGREACQADPECSSFERCLAD